MPQARSISSIPEVLAVRSDVLRSYGAAQSFVHLATNRMWLSPNWDVDLVAIRDLRYPGNQISLFLHEATHHWSFSLPVGMSLAMLEAEAWRSQLALSPGGELSAAEYAKAEPDTLSRGSSLWLRRYLIATALLPFFEGLALFAEFDLLVGASETLCQPTVWFMLQSMTSFTPGTLKILNDLGRAEHEAWFKSHECANAKVSLLESNYHATDGPHLFGYVFMKVVWTSLRRVCSALGDAQLFLSFIVDRVLNDCELAEIVGAFDRSLEDALRGVFDRIVCRFEMLGQGDYLRHEVAQFEQQSRQNPPSSARPTSLEHLRPEWTDLPTLERSLLGRILGFRDYMSVGAAEVAISVEGGVLEARIRSTGVLLWETSARMSPSPPVGMAEILFSPARRERIILLTSGSRLLAADTITAEGRLGEARDDAFGGFPFDIANFSGEQTKIHELMFADAKGHYGANFEALNLLVSKFAEEFYCTRMPSAVCGEFSLWRWHKRLRLRGFGDVLDRSELLEMASSGLPLGESRCEISERVALKLAEELPDPIVVNGTSLI